MKRWSQETVAEQMNMSTNGYAKIERGETRLNIDRLMQIAHIFNVDIIELLGNENGGMIFVVGYNSGHNANYHSSSVALAEENEKLKLTIMHQEEIIVHKEELFTQLRSEIKTLKMLVTVLKKQEL